MLHNNSDPYGSSDMPLNMGMGVTVNMAMNGPMNMPNGFNNLVKPHDALQTPNPHYNLMNYASYGHSVMPPQSPMHPFQNFQSNVFQASFMNHNPPSMHEPGWQHGLLPMNLNAHNESESNGSYYDRKDFSINNYKDQSCPSRSVPLNVPQVYPKPYHKEQTYSHPNYHSYQASNSSRDYEEANLDLSLNKTQKTETRNYDLDLSIKTPVMDETRRRSLENTVKMIENILIHNTTKNSQLSTRSDSLQVHHSVEDLMANDNVDNENKPNETSKMDLDEEEEKNLPESSKAEQNSNIKSIYSCSTENSVESEINSDERNNNFSIDNDNNDSSNNDNGTNYSSNNETDSKVEKIEIKVEFQPNENESDCEDIKPPKFNTIQNSLDEYSEMSQTDNIIEVKVEPLSSWVDLEQSNPFQRDIFGLMQVASNGIIIEAEVSISAAKEAAKNDAEPSENTVYYKCPNCDLYFSNPKRFLIHTKWHSFGLTNVKRTEEIEEIKKERELKRNQKKEARLLMKMDMEEIKDGNVPENAFKCNSCDKVFCTRSSLKNHKQRYHATRVLECRICDKRMVGWVAMRSHMATHTSDSRYQCTDCPKRFKYSHSLVKHRDTHLEKTHPCTQCSKMFGSQALLNTHMKTHERFQRGMTFHCSYCGKGFFESYNLQVHERTHRNERPFLCDICNTSFGTNSSLQRHLKVSHSSSKPFECATCHRNFISEKIRDRHALRHHGEPDQFKFQCTQCPSRYLNLKDLNKHVQKNHPRPGRKKRARKADVE